MISETQSLSLVTQWDRRSVCVVCRPAQEDRVGVNFLGWWARNLVGQIANLRIVNRPARCRASQPAFVALPARCDRRIANPPDPEGAPKNPQYRCTADGPRASATGIW